MLSDEEIALIKNDITVVMLNYGYSSQVKRVIAVLEKLIAEQDVPYLTDDELSNYDLSVDDDFSDETDKQ